MTTLARSSTRNAVARPATRQGRPRQGLGGIAGPCWADYGLGKCTMKKSCPACLNVRSRAIEMVGRDFPAVGAAVQQAITENA